MLSNLKSGGMETTTKKRIFPWDGLKQETLQKNIEENHGKLCQRSRDMMGFQVT